MKFLEKYSELRKKPKYKDLEYIHTSPFPRTIQTAEIVRNQLGVLELKPDIIFKEIYGIDDYEVPLDERRAAHRNAFLNPDNINPSGYSLSSASGSDSPTDSCGK